VALYLCKELPLSLWQPRTEEICVIGAWLLQHPLSAVENRLACVILEGLNWGHAQVVTGTWELFQGLNSCSCKFVDVYPIFFCRTALWSCRHFFTARWLCWWLKPIRSTSQINRIVASSQRESNRSYILIFLIHSL